jgi:hypothetical protein
VAFREKLRELLAHHAAAETADFLETIPEVAAAGWKPMLAVAG